MKKLIIIIGLLAFVGITNAQVGAFSKNLYFGFQDNEVSKLQEFLTDESLYTGPITGNFYSLTLKAVKDFQTREGISPVSGYFGPLTRARANTLLAGKITNGNEIIADNGTATSTPPKNTNDVVVSLQTQIDLLLAQVALLQQQQNSIAQIQQNTQANQATLQQIQVNTMSPSPIVMPPIEPPTGAGQGTPVVIVPPVPILPKIIPEPKMDLLVNQDGNTLFLGLTSTGSEDINIAAVVINMPENRDVKVYRDILSENNMINVSSRADGSGMLRLTFSIPMLLTNSLNLYVVGKEPITLNGQYKILSTGVRSGNVSEITLK